MKLSKATLKLLQELEAEYGSVAKCPRTDPRLGKLQSMATGGKKKRYDNFKNIELCDLRYHLGFLRELRKLFKNGYATSELADRYNVSSSYLNHIFNKYHFIRDERYRIDFLMSGTAIEDRTITNLSKRARQFSKSKRINQSNILKWIREPHTSPEDVRVEHKIKFYVPTDKQLKQHVYNAKMETYKNGNHKKIIDYLNSINKMGEFSYEEEINCSR